METNTDCTRSILENSNPYQTSGHLMYKLRVVLAFIGIVTLVIATYASLSFSKNCRELQCLGIIWIGAGNIASVFGLLPALYFWPWFTQRRIFKKVIIQKVFYIFAVATMIFEWIIILGSYEYWL